MQSLEAIRCSRMKPVYRSGEPIAAPDDSHTAYDCTWPQPKLSYGHFLPPGPSSRVSLPLGLPPSIKICDTLVLALSLDFELNLCGTFKSLNLILLFCASSIPNLITSLIYVSIRIAFHFSYQKNHMVIFKFHVIKKS